MHDDGGNEMGCAVSSPRYQSGRKLDGAQ